MSSSATELEGVCADSTVVAAWISGRLDPHTRAQVEAHADRCQGCLEVLAAVGRVCASELSSEHPQPDALTQWAVLEALDPPPDVGRYTFTSILGRGGFGVVYEGYDHELAREVAIKALWAGTDANGDAVRAEARALAALNHPNVVQVFDVVQRCGRTYVVMECVRGQTLRAWLAQERSDTEILHRYRAAGAGLIAIHNAGLVHRDIKPDNILLADDGRVLVADFGLAVSHEPYRDTGLARRPRDTGIAQNPVGTPGYVAPEQAHGHKPDARADQYSLSYSLWEALCGAPPGRPPQRSVAKHLLKTLRRGLEHNPARRWPSVAAMLAALSGKTPRANGPRWWASIAAATFVLALWAVPMADSYPLDISFTADDSDLEAAQEVFRLLDVARHQHNEGKLLEAAATLVPAAQQALPKTPRVQAKAQLELGNALGALGAWAEANEMLLSAYKTLAAEHADGLAAMAALALARHQSLFARRLDSQRTWVRIAATELERAGIDPQSHSGFRSASGQLAKSQGDDRAAEAHYREAVAQLKQAAPRQRALERKRWAAALDSLSEHETAFEHIEIARATLATEGATRSVEYVVVERGAATILLHLGKLDAAVMALDAAIAVANKISGYPPEDLSGLHSDLGVCHLRLHNRTSTLYHFKKALELAPTSWAAHANLGIHYSRLACRRGVVTDCDVNARELDYRHTVQALELAREQLADGNATFATLEANSAQSLLAMGRDEASVRRYESAIVTLDRTYGPSARQLMNPLFGLTQGYVRLQRREAAASTARRLHVVVHGGALRGRKAAAAVIDYAIGRTLIWAEGDSLASAEMITQANATFADQRPDDLMLIDAWFAPTQLAKNDEVRPATVRH